MKRLVIASLVASCMFTAASASDVNYLPISTKISVGTPVGTGGPTSLTYGGSKINCHATFYANSLGSLAGTAGTVDSAEFRTGVTDGVADSALCPLITANGVWTIAPPTSLNGPDNVTITEISVTIPKVATCTGAVTGTLINGTFNYSGTLEATTGGTCGITGRLQTTLSAVHL